MDSCGQCVGFRAKGLELPAVGEGHVCTPNDACPKHCPGFQIDFDKISEEIAARHENTVSAEPVEKNVDESKIIKEEVEQNPETHSCVKCGRTEYNGVLLPCRTNGNNSWICTKCLPSLIHG